MLRKIDFFFWNFLGMFGLKNFTEKILDICIVQDVVLPFSDSILMMITSLLMFILSKNQIIITQYNFFDAL